MRPTVMSIFSLTCVLAMAAGAFGQGDYRVVAVTDGGTVSGTVKWSGPVPRGLDSPVTKDPQICDPDSKKTADLDRLIVGPDGRLNIPEPQIKRSCRVFRALILTGES